MIAFLTWLVVNAPKPRIKSGLEGREGVGLENGGFSYLHIWWSLHILVLVFVYGARNSFHCSPRAECAFGKCLVASSFLDAASCAGLPGNALRVFSAHSKNQFASNSDVGVQGGLYCEK